MFNYSKSYFNETTNRICTDSCKYDQTIDKFNMYSIIPLSVADMDFKAPKEVIDSLKIVANHGIYGYSYCDNDYYKIVSNWFKRKHNLSIEPEDIIFCSRIVQAVSIIVQNFTKENDEILFFSPGYSPLKEAVINNNRKIINVPLIYKDNKYSLNMDLLKHSITRKTKLLILINPHNPTGKVWTHKELTDICKLCNENNIMVISDEIHNDFIRKGHKFTSVASLGNNIIKKYIICTSPSKTFNFPGLHISNIIIKDTHLKNTFTEGLIKNMVHEPNIFSINATKSALSTDYSYINELLNYIEGNYIYVKDIIKEKMPDLSIVEPEGTFLLWIDYSKTNLTEEDILNWTLNKAKVAVYLGSNFGNEGKGFIRINLATPRIILKDAMERLIENYPINY